jgi:TetR/AcrR family transcriptional regulator, cholesterol catabolism regulator
MAEAVPSDTQSATVGPPAAAGLTAKQRARRERVIDAGLTLLESRDYDRIQVKDVAEAANVALGTIYHYFSSKDHLFAEVLLKWAASLRTNVARHPLSGTSPAEQLTDVLHRSVRAFQRRPQLARLIATLQLSADPFAVEVMSRLSETTASIYGEVLGDIEPSIARAIVRVVEAVLAVNLGAWSNGRMAVNDVLAHLTEAVDLLFSPLDPATVGRAPRSRG